MSLLLLPLRCPPLQRHPRRNGCGSGAAAGLLSQPLQPTLFAFKLFVETRV
jgi:hypothetical protein